jgi:hypothetical protein
MSFTYNPGVTWVNGATANATNLNNIVANMSVSSSVTTCVFGFDGSGNATSVLAGSGLTISGNQIYVPYRPLVMPSQISVTNNNSPSAVAALTYASVAPGYYALNGVLFCQQSGSGNYDVAVGGTATTGQGTIGFGSINTASEAFSQLGALPVANGFAPGTNNPATIRISGGIQITGSGSLYVAFSQFTATGGTSFLNAGSFFSIAAQ